MWWHMIKKITNWSTINLNFKKKKTKNWKKWQNSIAENKIVKLFALPQRADISSKILAINDNLILTQETCEAIKDA